VAFHAQQAAEKFIKALLQHRRTDFPKTHNLVELVRLLDPPETRLTEMAEPLGDLSAMAVEVRYPGATMSTARAGKACDTADRVRSICLELVGLEP
jgi:HEPN domain-containing protein